MAAQPDLAFLEKLNPEQRRAVEHGRDGEDAPLLVAALAGCVAAAAASGLHLVSGFD